MLLGKGSGYCHFLVLLRLVSLVSFLNIKTGVSLLNFMSLPLGGNMSVWRIQQHNAAQSWCFVFNLNLIRDHFVAKLWSFLLQLILRWLQLSCSQHVRGSMGTVMKGRGHYVILSIFTRYFIGVCEPRFAAKLYQWER